MRRRQRYLATPLERVQILPLVAAAGLGSPCRLLDGGGEQRQRTPTDGRRRCGGVVARFAESERLYAGGNAVQRRMRQQLRNHGGDGMAQFPQPPRRTRIDRQGEGLRLGLNDGSHLDCDGVLYATGRHPNSGNLGLEACGVRLDGAGAIVVDDQYRTSVPSIHAVGDVTNRVNLTPVALAEGMAVARRLYAGMSYEVDYDYIPTAVFSQPPIGTVGLTEEAAQTKYGALDIYTSSFTPLRFTISPVKEKAFMKLIVEKAGQRVVGLHMCGEDAGEITQGFAVAMRAGATKQVFDTTIGIHPTAAEEFVTMREPTRST